MGNIDRVFNDCIKNLKNMEDKYQKFHYIDEDYFYDGLINELYHKPMTPRNFIEQYNFNNPKVEDDWECELLSTCDNLYYEYLDKECDGFKVYGDYNIKICYL